MADQPSTDSLTTHQRLVGWLRFLVYLIGLIMVSHSVAQVYQHWQPGDSNSFLHALSSFVHYLWPRLLIGVVIGAIFLGIAMLFKQRPPWLDDT
ncbi:hypothetical protein [Rhodopirellula sp. SWK7]|uniref:hypothetical protein n=1 Tax=Rhodopirellula sp. SWK7 TaxID=595460 RepID=UPI0002BEA6C5|nr:hypothetical protein [Rhodopirellula sp. SWK7]EMI41042.1 membrane protein [Rhodopirellula sp. SWK7]